MSDGRNRGKGKRGAKSTGKTPSARQRLKDGLGTPLLHMKIGDGETSAERVVPVPADSGIWRGMRPGSGASVQDISGLTKRPAITPEISRAALSKTPEALQEEFMNLVEKNRDTDTGSVIRVDASLYPESGAQSEFQLEPESQSESETKD